MKRARRCGKCEMCKKPRWRKACLNPPPEEPPQQQEPAAEGPPPPQQEQEAQQEPQQPQQEQEPQQEPQQPPPQQEEQEPAAEGPPPPQPGDFAGVGTDDVQGMFRAAIAIARAVGVRDSDHVNFCLSFFHADNDHRKCHFHCLTKDFDGGQHDSIRDWISTFASDYAKKRSGA